MKKTIKSIMLLAKLYSDEWNKSSEESIVESKIHNRIYLLFPVILLLLSIFLCSTTGSLDKLSSIVSILSATLFTTFSIFLYLLTTQIKKEYNEKAAKKIPDREIRNGQKMKFQFELHKAIKIILLICFIGMLASIILSILKF